jgi:hypothetical protein
MWRKLLPLLIPIAAAALLPSLGAAQEGANRAGLVVRFGDGRVVQSCVNFAEESLSGEELLARSGLPVIAQSSGAGTAVCKIGDEGCDYPAQDCFCKCTGANCAYWALSRLEGSAWRYSNQGATNVQVRNGDVQGWAWGAGGVQGGASPPVRSFAELCEVAPTAQPATAAPPPTVAPPPTPRPTRAPPTASPTAPPPSAPTAEPSATGEPTATATAAAPATATAAPTNQATSTPAAASPTASPEAAAALPAPTSAPVAAEQAPQGQPPGTPPTGYVALAALVGALLLGWAVVAWRRRQ